MQPLGDAKRLDDLPCGPVGDADMANETLLHQMIKRADCFFDRRRRVEAVNLIQIDMVEL